MSPRRPPRKRVLSGDTHKFESRYLDGLVGRYPEDKAIYQERAPIRSVDTLSCPILLLQGAEDKVVPPNQAEEMRRAARCFLGGCREAVPTLERTRRRFRWIASSRHKALLAKNLPCAIKIYEGEQHGFRKSENIEDALNSELYFFSKVFGFDCLKANPEVEVFPIDNLAP